jgi:hypothetical protein
VFINDSEDASMSISREEFHRLTGKFLAAGFASKDEESIAPCGDENG